MATVYYAISALLTNTLGVFVASSGSAPLSKALRQSLRAPVLYATILGITLNRLAVPVPDPLYRAVDLLAGAAVPMMLVLLGIQLSVTPFNREQSVVWRTLAIRLGASPLVAVHGFEAWRGDLLAVLKLPAMTRDLVCGVLIYLVLLFGDFAGAQFIYVQF
jgi:predicted permease